MRQWPEILREHGQTIPDLGRTLQQLKDWGMHLGIVTGSQGQSFQPLHEAGLLDFFEAVIIGSDVEQGKPHPEGLFKCLAALGVEAGEAVYVGDTPTDIQASRTAGMASVAVLSGAGDSALLSAEGPDWIISSHVRLPEILVRKPE